MFPAFGDINPPTPTTIAVVIVVCLGLILVGATKLGITLIVVFVAISLIQFLLSRWS
jgi:type IV secretory pathway VirB2 component (pilin)